MCGKKLIRAIENHLLRPVKKKSFQLQITNYCVSVKIRKRTAKFAMFFGKLPIYLHYK